MAFKVPHISQAEIAAFHDAHFSPTALNHFTVDFLPSVAAEHSREFHDSKSLQYVQHLGDDLEWDDEYEDDGLGYYPDGVKRTLTDEQIEIFRHSELEALRRADDKATKLRDESARLLELARHADAETDGDFSETVPKDHRVATSGTCAAIVDLSSEPQSGSEDGECEDDNSTQSMTEAEAKRLKKKRARQRKKEKNKKFHPEPKVDLRKRTWDVVDAGMDSLDYDERENDHAKQLGLASKRRQISYDD
ncbi:uncharacterized protein B0I36DRAFT_141849 [Microdochium trichocladiopsis]|uniref:Uncharacterized protein n=1 Tax=Microdochium trichocladiopsis TaxID=1682393 RepID=A0A9P8Y1V6_9PEZI|nr:uncharacterized protein B0I36DRAFT_141849 [Microdochium trichocladiopsis]KAH7027677.1 hypothetical protein B0I36DRAFT_141849 [Microdochium trichocladiopsis]